MLISFRGPSSGVPPPPQRASSLPLYGFSNFGGLYRSPAGAPVSLVRNSGVLKLLSTPSQTAPDSSLSWKIGLSPVSFLSPLKNFDTNDGECFCSFQVFELCLVPMK